MNKIVLFIFLMSPFLTYAQVTLKGTVKSNDMPVAGANVVLTDKAGSIIKGVFTTDIGNFEMAVRNGRYKIRISFLGLDTWERDIQLNKDTALGIIHLKETGGRLKEVVITSRKKLIEYRPDRLIFNVENSISAAGGNAVNAISAAPGVIIRNNDIILPGKGTCRVMVNGRLIELSGHDLINYLGSIAASDIKSIEVITNPPSNYDAGGAGGLININLKKGVRNSWKNSTNLAYDQNTYAYYTLRNSFLYNKDRLRLSISAGGRAGYRKTTEELNTHYARGPWELAVAGKEKEDNLSASIALDYDISEKLSAGFQYAGTLNKPDRTDLTRITVRNALLGIDSFLINNGNNNLGNTIHAYNVHVISKLDTLGRKIAVDLDRFTYSSDIDNNFTTSGYSPGMEFLHINQAARNISHQDIFNTSIKADIEHPLRSFELSYGAKLSFIDSKAGVQYYNTISGRPVPDPSRSNEFAYRETNRAVYVNGSRNFTSGLSLQLGLRLENTTTDGHAATSGERNKNTYLKLFPAFYLSYKKNAGHSFLFNYGRRIKRPGFSDMNPFRSYINSKSYSEGNPFLQPSVNDNFELSHIYRSLLKTTVFFNITSNGFGVIFTANPESNTQIITRQNYFREYAYGISENYTANISSWWESSTSIYLLGSKSRFINAIKAEPLNTLQLYCSSNNTFTISPVTKLQVDYFYSSPFKKGLYEIGYMSGLNIGVKQNLLKNKLQLSLLINDIFETAYLKDYNSMVNGIRQEYSQNNSSRYFRLSLSYQFGNDKINIRKRSGGNDEERKRTGQE